MDFLEVLKPTVEIRDRLYDSAKVFNRIVDGNILRSIQKMN